MKICVLNGSPKGDYSITYQSVLYLKKHFKNHSFETINVGKDIKKLETAPYAAFSALRNCDLILFAFPVYTFMAPYQLHKFIEILKANEVDLIGKMGAVITTSKHFYDVTAHKYIEDNCKDLGIGYIGGLSADMEDLLTKKGQSDLLKFFKYVEFAAKESLFTNKRGRIRPVKASAKLKRIAVVTNLEKDDEKLASMIEAFKEINPYKTDVINIKEFKFGGGCISCFRCAPKGECIYKDGFSDLLRKRINTADSIVFAFTIKDHSMGASFKLYDDRQFCNGHRTVNEGMPMGYIINGDIEKEPNLKLLIEGRSQVGGNFLAGIAVDKITMNEMMRKLVYSIENSYTQPANFYGVGGMNIFRDLIYITGGLMRADDKFYRQKGLYKTMPHKQIGKKLGLKVVGLMMSNPKIVKKMGNKMNEGMIMPYKKILKDK